MFIREGEERSRQNIKIRIGKADSQWDKDFKMSYREYGREPLVEGSDSAVQDTKSISSSHEGIASSQTSPKGSIIPLGSSGVTYYIHSYDGKVLAEYDQNGNCVRDYIYVVDLLRAEYRPLEGKYYYYTSDQVNSVRVVTDDAGNAVYSAGYSPYGKIQEEWVTTYQPSLKFSGKERETNSEVDYFGARYYNHKHYRFLSVDPVINRDEALSNPQLWNLYSYCRNNPITYWDPDGSTVININIKRMRFSTTATLGTLSVAGTGISGYTLEPPWMDNIKDKSCIKCDTYEASVEKWSKNSDFDVIRLEDKHGREDVLMHPGKKAKHTTGCIIPGSGQDVANETISGSPEMLKEITDCIKKVQVIDYLFKKEKTEIRVNIGVEAAIVNSMLSSIKMIY